MNAEPTSSDVQTRRRGPASGSPANRLMLAAGKVPNGGLLWEGPSEINGEPIFVAVTGLRSGSANPKIGKMAQLWILAMDPEPLQAVPNGLDVSVCGLCKHRPSVGGKCYVNARWGPQQVWFTHRRFGSYPQLPLWVFEGKRLRFGAYGDPAAVPLEVWLPLLPMSAGWTGYTHQWRDRRADEWGWLMASVDTPEEYREAKAAGWRAFRVRKAGTPLLPKEIDCPAAAIPKRTDCANCLLCDGLGFNNGMRNRVKDIAIVEHGSRIRTAGGKDTKNRGKRVKRNGLTIHVGLRTIERAKNALREEPQTDAELAATLGLSTRNCGEMMKALRAGKEVVQRGVRDRAKVWGTAS